MFRYNKFYDFVLCVPKQIGFHKKNSSDLHGSGCLVIYPL